MKADQGNGNSIHVYLDQPSKVQNNSAKVILDTGEAIRVCPLLLWRIALIDRNDSNNDLRFRSRQQNIRQKGATTHVQRKCAMSPHRSLPSPTFANKYMYGCSMGKDNMYILPGGRFQSPTGQSGQHLFTDPSKFCEDCNEYPCVVRPVCSDTPAIVAPTFARSSNEFPEGTPATGRSSPART